MDDEARLDAAAHDTEVDASEAAESEAAESEAAESESPTMATRDARDITLRALIRMAGLSNLSGLVGELEMVLELSMYVGDAASKNLGRTVAIYAEAFEIAAAEKEETATERLGLCLSLLRRAQKALAEVSCG